MIQFDAATILLQWATGGLLFLAVTTRRREVGLGYGWLMRGVFGGFALLSALVGGLVNPSLGRDMCALASGLAATAVFVFSVLRRKAGVRGQREAALTKTARISEMTGIERDIPTFDANAKEFDPRLDWIAPTLGLVGVIFAADAAGGPFALALYRFLVGTLLFGCVSDAMLLGHWYLVQPGLRRAPIIELNAIIAVIWPFELAGLLWPTGMQSVLSGAIDDGYGGMLGWFWIGCTALTIVLCGVTHLALKERFYSAVMAATGFLYLAILTAFGMDLVARAVLA